MKMSRGLCAAASAELALKMDASYRIFPGKGVGSQAAVGESWVRRQEPCPQTLYLSKDMQVCSFSSAQSVGHAGGGRGPGSPGGFGGAPWSSQGARNPPVSKYACAGAPLPVLRSCPRLVLQCRQGVLLLLGSQGTLGQRVERPVATG